MKKMLNRGFKFEILTKEMYISKVRGGGGFAVRVATTVVSRKWWNKFERAQLELLISRCTWLRTNVEFSHARKKRSTWSRLEASGRKFRLAKEKHEGGHRSGIGTLHADTRTHSLGGRLCICEIYKESTKMGVARNRFSREGDVEHENVGLVLDIDLPRAIARA